MNLLRKLLFPFAILYGLIEYAEFFFDTGFKIVLLICLLLLLGILALVELENTQIEYLIGLLSDQYKVAT
jgi:tetraacyldisaccharide 4'-kinase